jgi:hypothetical protein
MNKLVYALAIIFIFSYWVYMLGEILLIFF